MDDSSNNNYKIKATLIYVLHQIAKGDNDEHIHEMAFITEISKRLGITSEEFITIKSSKNFELNFPKGEEDRIYFFFHALQLVEIDNKILNEEIVLLKQLGLKLSLNPMMIDDLVNLYVNNIGKEIDPKIISQTIKKYLN